MRVDYIIIPEGFSPLREALASSLLSFEIVVALSKAFQHLAFA